MSEPAIERAEVVALLFDVSDIAVMLRVSGCPAQRLESGSACASPAVRMRRAPPNQVRPCGSEP